MGALAPDPSLTECGQLLEALLRALRGVDQPGAMRVVDRAMKLGWTVDDVRFQLVTPALYEVGLRWQRAEIGVADEHLACSVCEWLLFALAGRVRRPPAPGGGAPLGWSRGGVHKP